MPDWGALVRQAQMGPPGPHTSPANPNDPNQQMNWAIGRQNAIANQGLFDPAQLQEIMKQLAPLFQRQTANLNQAQNRSLGTATRQASSYASSQGYDNPYALIQRARSGVYSGYAPQYGQLEENQLMTGLNANVQNQQFRYGNARDMTQLWSQLMMLNEQMKNQPGFFENMFGGLLQAGGQLGSAAILAAAL